jgi:arginyl-tRNA synthetase
MDNIFALTLKKIINEEFNYDIEPTVEPTSDDFGDVSTNVAMQLANRLQKNPREIAEFISVKLKNLEDIKEVSVAGPGFINIRFTNKYHSKIVDAIILKGDDFGKNNIYFDKVVVCEYSDPNPFKVLHAGHLYTSLIGDAIGNLFEVAGAKVHRVNFGGDVGLHVAKACWAIVKAFGGENQEGLNSIPENERLDWVSARYIEGNDAYESSDVAKAEIMDYNKKIYALHENGDKDSAFAQIYWTCRQWSYNGFDELYKKLAMQPFEKYYPESLTTPLGLDTVRLGQEKGVFEESEGAIIYKGEKDGLHTRVFITKEGLPTYEAKDLGLALSKWQDYNFDKSIIITANDIVEYMKVVQKAVSNFHPEIAERTKHLTHGIVKLTGGVKMSSRKGNFLRAEDILTSAKDAYIKATKSDDWGAVLAAVKYAFLKQRIGGDIIYSPEESVSITGNSGPYLQYAHARARSIINKSNVAENYEASDTELPLLKKLEEYESMIEKSINEVLPHHVATYLFELAQTFNSLYEKERIIGSDREGQKVRLVNAYSQVLKNGLSILGITAPESM